MKDYYKFLGIKSDATTDSVKQRFRELAFENHPDVSDVSASAMEDARQKAKSKYMDFIKDYDCFFKKGQKADGIPFTYNMHKTTGISGGAGPMGSIKSRAVRIPIPRSRRAQMIHRTGFLIKAGFFIIAFLSLKADLIPVQGWILKLMISFSITLTGGLLVLLVYHLNSTKSKFFHAKKYFLVSKYRSKGFARGFHPIITTTPAGLIAYLLRLIF
jgi:hypothetical protein